MAKFGRCELCSSRMQLQRTTRGELICTPCAKRFEETAERAHNAITEVSAQIRARGEEQAEKLRELVARLKEMGVETSFRSGSKDGTVCKLVVVDTEIVVESYSLAWNDKATTFARALAELVELPAFRAHCGQAEGA